MLGKDAVDTFREYLRTVVSAAAGCSSSEDVRFQTVRTTPTAHVSGIRLTKSIWLSLPAVQAISALNRFAEVAANKSERFGTAFLTELLTLHAGKSIALTKIDTKMRLGEVSRGLVVQQRS